MAIPMYLLYEGGVVMARVMQKMRLKDAEAADKEEAEAS
jgi:Sec-independent protein secretion pathway component TatC